MLCPLGENKYHPAQVKRLESQRGGREGKIGENWGRKLLQNCFPTTAVYMTRCQIEFTVRGQKKQNLNFWF